MRKFSFVLAGVFASALMASDVDARGGGHGGKIKPPIKKTSKVEPKKTTKAPDPLSKQKKKQKEYDDAMINAGIIAQQIASY